MIVGFDAWLLSLALVSQTPAPRDFSGTWVIDAARSSTVGGGQGTVQYREARYLDGETLVVEITMKGSPNSRKAVYTRKRE